MTNCTDKQGPFNTFMLQLVTLRVSTTYSKCKEAGFSLTVKLVVHRLVNPLCDPRQPLLEAHYHHPLIHNLGTAYRKTKTTETTLNLHWTFSLEDFAGQNQLIKRPGDALSAINRM